MTSKKNAVQLDQEHQFTGVTIKINSISNIKTQVDGGQLYVKIKCNDKSVSTKKKLNDRSTLTFQQSFFYNTTEIIDDDIVFQLYALNSGDGASKMVLSSSKVSMTKSKVNQYEGKLIGATKDIQVSRLNRQKQQKSYDFLSHQNKKVGTITVGYDYLERQDIVGGIKCPNLSLKPGASLKGSLTLQNKYAAYKNLYSFLDGNQTPNCQLFPKKFHQ